MLFRSNGADPGAAAAVGLPTPPPLHLPSRHRAALVFLGGLVRVEVSVPRAAASRPPPPRVSQAAAAAPAAAMGVGEEAGAASAPTSPPPAPTAAPTAAVRSSADALRHLASFAALTADARSPTPCTAGWEEEEEGACGGGGGGDGGGQAATSSPLQSHHHQAAPFPLRESTTSINCSPPAHAVSPDMKGPSVLATAAVSPRLV